MDLQPVQSVPRLSPNDSWDKLYSWPLSGQVVKKMDG